jgi:hypothetical protein
MGNSLKISGKARSHAAAPEPIQRDNAKSEPLRTKLGSHSSDNLLLAGIGLANVAVVLAQTVAFA